MLLSKNGRMGAVIVLLSLLFGSRCYRQEDELEKVLLEVEDVEEKSKSSADGIKTIINSSTASLGGEGVGAGSGSEMACADIVDKDGQPPDPLLGHGVASTTGTPDANAQQTRKQSWKEFFGEVYKERCPKHEVNLFCITLGNQKDQFFTLEKAFQLGGSCSVASAKAGITLEDGGLEVIASASGFVSAGSHGANIRQLVANFYLLDENARMTPDAAKTAFGAALETGVTWLYNRGHPMATKAADILSGTITDPAYTIKAKVTFAIPGLAYGGSAAAYAGLWEDSSGYRQLGATVAGKMGLEVQGGVVFGFREMGCENFNPAFKIKIAAPQVTVELEMKPVGT